MFDEPIVIRAVEGQRAVAHQLCLLTFPKNNFYVYLVNTNKLKVK